MFDISVISLQGGSIHLRTEIPANTDNTFNLQLANGIYILRVNNKGIVMTQRYMSVAYTQFSISSNGQMRLGPVAISSVNYTNPAANQTILAPMSGFNSIQAQERFITKLLELRRTGF